MASMSIMLDGRLKYCICNTGVFPGSGDVVLFRPEPLHGDQTCKLEVGATVVRDSSTTGARHLVRLRLVSQGSSHCVCAVIVGRCPRYSPSE